MRVNQQAARDEQPTDHRTDSRAQTLLLHACPLGGPVPGLTAWTMTRVQTAQGLDALRLGLGVLFTLMLAMSAWLGRTLMVWGRHVRSIETALGANGQARSNGAQFGMPMVPRTGERELDRIIDALNDAASRLTEARREADQMATRVARAERLAGLGRVAAGIAHEIRNPIAAARLQGENALAGDDARRREAIGDMLAQIDRLDALVGELLAMTQRVAPRPVPLELRAFLRTSADAHKDTAAAKTVTLLVQAPPVMVKLDPGIVGRILDNLLNNAIRHVPPGGRVMVSAECDPSLLSISVEDTGPGVSADLTEHLFEPFVTSRADGTGLGLAIARELADAHGGRLVLRRTGGHQPGEGAIFALELPRGDACPPS
jgi:signal transduction histidine kinase